MKEEKFSVSKRLKSFKYAFNGLKVLLKEEHNARIHLVVTVAVVIAALFLQLSLVEYCLLSFAVGLVFAAELINSAIENLADYISPEKNELIKKAKDLAAAAVLVCAVTAVTVGVLVLGPKILALLQL